MYQTVIQIYNFGDKVYKVYFLSPSFYKASGPGLKLFTFVLTGMLGWYCYWICLLASPPTGFFPGTCQQMTTVNVCNKYAAA